MTAGPVLTYACRRCAAVWQVAFSTPRLPDRLACVCGATADLRPAKALFEGPDPWPR